MSNKPSTPLGIDEWEAMADLPQVTEADLADEDEAEDEAIQPVVGAVDAVDADAEPDPEAFLNGLDLAGGLFDLPEDVEGTPDDIAHALHQFATTGPREGPPIHPLPRASNKRARQEIPDPQQLIPEILTELGLDGYDIIRIWELGAVERFLGLFLPSVKEAYTETGCGVYDCILQFKYATANEDQIKRFRASASMMLSRVRKAAPGTPAFKFVFMRYEILPDKRHVACSFARMTEAVYTEWLARRRSKAYEDRSTLNLLKEYL